MAELKSYTLDANKMVAKMRQEEQEIAEEIGRLVERLIHVRDRLAGFTDVSISVALKEDPNPEIILEP